MHSGFRAPPFASPGRAQQALPPLWSLLEDNSPPGTLPRLEDALHAPPQPPPRASSLPPPVFPGGTPFGSRTAPSWRGVGHDADEPVRALSGPADLSFLPPLNTALAAATNGGFPSFAVQTHRATPPEALPRKPAPTAQQLAPGETHLRNQQQHHPQYQHPQHQPQHQHHPQDQRHPQHQPQHQQQHHPQQPHPHQQPRQPQQQPAQGRTDPAEVPRVPARDGERVFLCTVPGCGKTFRLCSGLTRHRRTHTGERPFVCDFEGCGVAFAASHNLKRHSLIHTGEKPYACGVPGCDRKFRNSSHRRRHERSHANPPAAGTKRRAPPPAQE